MTIWVIRSKIGIHEFLITQSTFPCNNYFKPVGLKVLKIPCKLSAELTISASASSKAKSSNLLPSFKLYFFL